MDEEEQVAKVKKLTPKEQAFVEEFLITWSPTKAAKAAGYAHPEKCWKISARPDVAAAIQARLEEKAITAGEVIARLCEQATVNPADFFNFDIHPDGQMVMKSIKWEEFYRRGHLVKNVTYNRRGEPVLEFHDAQAALIQIGKYLKLFTDQVDVTSKGEALSWLQFVLKAKEENAAPPG